jgi:hypothetical protein
MSDKYLGKFRGKVLMNVDPLMQGRIVALVPAVSELPLSWALPCAPYAGSKVGFFALPPVGSNVWIEFERGDPNYPIWTGGFWAQGEAPAQPAVPTTKVLKTEHMSVSLDDLKLELKAEVMTPAGSFRVVVSPEGAEVTTGPSSFTVQPQKVEATNAASSATVSPESVTLASGTGSAEVGAQAVSLKNGAAAVEVTPANVGLKNGSASVDLSPASVSLNKGALEVI